MQWLFPILIIAGSIVLAVLIVTAEAKDHNPALKYKPTAKPTSCEKAASSEKATAFEDAYHPLISEKAVDPLDASKQVFNFLKYLNWNKARQFIYNGNELTIKFYSDDIKLYLETDHSIEYKYREDISYHDGGGHAYYSFRLTATNISIPNETESGIDFDKNLLPSNSGYPFFRSTTGYVDRMGQLKIQELKLKKGLHLYGNHQKV